MSQHSSKGFDLRYEDTYNLKMYYHIKDIDYIEFETKEHAVEFILRWS